MKRFSRRELLTTLTVEDGHRRIGLEPPAQELLGDGLEYGGRQHDKKRQADGVQAGAEKRGRRHARKADEVAADEEARDRPADRGASARRNRRQPPPSAGEGRVHSPPVAHFS